MLANHSVYVFIVSVVLLLVLPFHIFFGIYFHDFVVSK